MLHRFMRTSSEDYYVDFSVVSCSQPEDIVSILLTMKISPWPWHHSNRGHEQIWTVSGRPKHVHLNHSFKMFVKQAVLLLSLDDLLHLLPRAVTLVKSLLSLSGWMSCDLYLVRGFAETVIWLAVIILLWVTQTCSLVKSHLWSQDVTCYPSVASGCCTLMTIKSQTSW